MIRNKNNIFLAEKEADNVIKEFLHSSEEERQTQSQLLEMEQREEMQILSRSHSEQSLHRTKDTLCMFYIYLISMFQYS